MATSSAAAVSSISLLPTSLGSTTTPGHQRSLYNGFQRQSRIGNKPISLTIRAAKVPAGVEMPKSEPKLSAPFLGFTKTAEIWNSRACMIGLIGTFIVELILNKGILQMIGVEIGKGLDLPL